MKKLFIVLALIFCTGCSLWDIPDISIINELSPLTQEEFMDINILESEDISISDLRYYNLVVKGTNIVNTELREVAVPSMMYITKAIKDYNKDAWALGSSINQDNKQEDFFLYEYKILLNMKNMTQEELRNILDNFAVIVYIKQKSGIEFSNKISLGTDLEIK